MGIEQARRAARKALERTYEAGPPCMNISQ